MMLAVLLWVGMAHAQTCESVASVPDSLQVAWVSRVGKQVSANAAIEVVRTGDLRAWVKAQGKDQLRLLRGLGMLSARGGGWAQQRRYKVTVFDIKPDWLCRPISEVEPGTDSAGLPVCEPSQQRPSPGHRPGFTGCGYGQDTQTDQRGLDVYRIRWADAASWGFCVLPLERFLDGA